MILELSPRKFLRTVFEDDGSTSSTLTVDRANKQLSRDEDDDSISSSDTTPIKSVRFDMNVVEHENTQMYEDEVAELWYTPYDYKRFRGHTQALAREIQRAETKNRAPYSYERVMLHTYSVCCEAVTETQTPILTADERKHVNRWAEVAPNRLGLEKWAVKTIGRDRQVRRNELLDVVMDLQEVQLKNREDCIRKNSERISRASRLFARATAQAQAAVLIKDVFFAASVEV